MVYTRNNSYQTKNSRDRMKKIENNFIATIGLAIATERKKRRLTQSQLAELSNTSINFVSQVESGKITAQIGKVIELLNTLGLQLVIEKGSAGVINHVG